MISNYQQDRPPERAWRDRAACREIDNPELFFPTAESGPARTAQIAAAKAVCARCPVRQACLEEALRRIPYGICGGLTEHERHVLRHTAPVSAATSVSGDGLAGECLRPGLTARAAARERARVGRALLAAGCSARQIARACGVSARTVQRWITPSHTNTDSTPTGTTSTDTDTGDGMGAAGRDGGSGAGEGSAAATELPSGSSQHATARQAYEHRKGDRA